MAEKIATVGKTKFQYVQAIHNKKWAKALGIAASRKNQFPALIIAIDNNCSLLAKELIAMGWNVNEERERDGSTPLHSAALTRNYDVVVLLVEKGAKVGKKDDSGNLPAIKCLKSRQELVNRKIWQVLANKMEDADYKQGNAHGETMLHVMAKNNTVPFEVFSYVMYRGVDVNAKDEFTGRTFLMDMIIFFNNEDFLIRIAMLAMKYGLDINQPDKFGSTLLLRMVSEGRIELLKWCSGLREVKIRTKNMNGQTPMWIGAKRGNRQAMRILYLMGESLQGCAYDFPNCEGKSLHQIAFSNGHQELAKDIETEIKGEQNEKGRRRVKCLLAITREVIRETLVAKGVNIKFEMDKLEIPRTLKQYVVTLDGI